jgi:hypothetical protein
VLAAVAPIALGAAIDPGWWTAVKVLMLFAVIEPFTGYVVEPLLYGHSTGLSPISVIVAAVFWTWVWGPIGLILSTPLTLCLVVLGRHVKSLEFFDVLLGDRAPLAPGETLYQRILADNPDEALDKAEELLGNRPLLEYYDGVVLEALRLAAQDEARGAIAHERAARMTRSMLQVIDDLEEHVDVHAASEAALARSAPAAAAGVVVCVSGHGVFDDAVSGMLAQLLVRRGTAAKRVPHAAITRDRIAALDLRGVRVVALSYLDTAGSLTRLRYTVRRIRQHSSEVTIVVGLWPAGDDAGRAPSRDSVGADRYVASLREALDACS